MRNKNQEQNIPAVVSEPPENKKSILEIGSVTVAKLLTVLVLMISIFYSIFISFSPYRLAAGGICVLLWILYRKVKKLTIPFAVLFELAALLAILYIGFLFQFPPFIVTHSPWKYPVQKAYIDLYQNIKEPDYFPDFTDAVISDYTFSYMPSILQGAGHYCVSFITAPEQAQEYEKIYSGQAQYHFPMTELHGHSYELDRENFKSVSVIVSSLWEESSFEEYAGETHTNIYILSTNADWNHPHTSAVIVDSQSGRIEFSQLG